MLFPCLAIFIIFLLTLTYFRNQATREAEAKQKRFWDKEIAANQTRRKDITDLPFIVVPIMELPFDCNSSAECVKIERELKELSKEKILNLSGMSNTDLKLEYGAANLPSLSQYDLNFTQLTALLYKYGKVLADAGNTDEAITVLEYAVSIKTDMSKLFVLLAKLYKEKKQTEKIEELILKSSYLSPLLKDATVKQLKELL